MKLTESQLLAQLSKKPASLYLLTGDEILLVNDALELIRVAALKAGFVEHIKLFTKTQTDWLSLFYNTLSTGSLFTTKRLIEIHHDDNKLGVALAKSFKEIAETTFTDAIVIVRINKIDKKSESSAWYKAFDKYGSIMTFWPISQDGLSAWIMQRAKKKSLPFTPDAASFLAEKVEGNLLAAAQEIEKLTLLDISAINRETIEEVATNNLHFDIYQLVECALAGQAERSLRILATLKEEDNEPILILWVLAKEIRALAQMAKLVKEGTPLAALFSRFRIWDKRQAGVRHFLQTHDTKSCWDLLVSASYLDELIKGAAIGNVWQALTDLTLKLSGNDIIKLSPNLV